MLTLTDLVFGCDYWQLDPVWVKAVDVFCVVEQNVFSSFLSLPSHEKRKDTYTVKKTSSGQEMG